MTSTQLGTGSAASGDETRQMSANSELERNGQNTAQPYAELWLRGLAAVIEALVFMALSIPVAFALPLLISRMDASIVLPEIPGYFFMEGFAPAVAIPFFAFWVKQHMTAQAMVGVKESSTLLIWMFTIGFLVVTNMLYHVIMESSRYQGTLGKIVVGAKVTNSKGERLSLGAALVRHFARLLSMLPCFAGYLLILKTAKHQALHDKLSGSLVIKIQPDDIV